MCALLTGTNNEWSQMRDKKLIYTVFASAIVLALIPGIAACSKTTTSTAAQSLRLPGMMSK
jgi:hypothetical protein